MSAVGPVAPSSASAAPQEAQNGDGPDRELPQAGQDAVVMAGIYWPGNFPRDSTATLMPNPHCVTLRFLAEPGHVNFGGKVHGGAVMKWIDQAGYTCAAGWTGEYCVTIYVGGIRFLRPINVGELVELKAQVIRTGRTSLHVAVDVYAGDPRTSTHARACHCVMVFVAVDESGRPKPVPSWAPGTPVEQALEAYALRLIEVRKMLDVEIEQQLAWLDQPRPAVAERR
jgi:uncharacterized protein (TIGR00369 family)